MGGKYHSLNHKNGSGNDVLDIYSKHTRDHRICLHSNWSVPFAAAYSSHQDAEGYLPYLYIVITFRYQNPWMVTSNSLIILLISACKPTQTWTPRPVIPPSAQKAIPCLWPLLEARLSPSMHRLRLSCSSVLAKGGSIFLVNRNLRIHLLVNRNLRLRFLQKAYRLPPMLLRWWSLCCIKEHKIVG